jgi:hypothetical protein
VGVVVSASGGDRRRYSADSGISSSAIRVSVNC